MTDQITEAQQLCLDIMAMTCGQDHWTDQMKRAVVRQIELAIDLAAKRKLNDPTFPRPSQNQTVASGVEGAHEGTSADKSALLPTQLPKEKE